MKRYCQTLELRDDREMIEKYVEAHAHVWPEIQEGIRSVGILDMQIYILGNRLFMICDTVDDFLGEGQCPPGNVAASGRVGSLCGTIPGMRP